MTCSQVDFENRGVWLAAEATKGARADFVPANSETMAILSRLVARAHELGLPWLLTYCPPGRAARPDQKTTHRVPARPT